MLQLKNALNYLYFNFVTLVTLVTKKTPSCEISERVFFVILAKISPRLVGIGGFGKE